jgi:AraC-like DNA-binding protein
MKRCEKARTMILSGEYTITEAALSSGFSNLSYFAKVFKKVTGSLPTEILQNRK